MIWLVAIGTARGAEPDLAARLCAGRSPCRVVGTASAGRGPGGEALSVAEIVLAEVADADLDAARQAVFGGACVPFEHHAVVEARGAVHTALIAETCNDGYGASGVGEDEFAVDPNRVTHRRYGGSSWRWSESDTWQLWPWQHLTSAGGNDYFDQVHVTTATDWTVPSRTVRGTLWRCVDGAEEGAELPIAAVLVPRVPADPGWPTSGLRGPAARVDSAGADGLVVFGAPSDRADASLAAALTPDGELRVEVVDDRLVSGTKRWLAADHLEVWQAEDRSPFDPDCLPPLPARQWAVLLDGTVVSAEGAPPIAGLGASVHVDGNTARFTLRLTDPPERFTVVWSDGDDGKRQERLIATSAVVHGDGWTLGGAWSPPTPDDGSPEGGYAPAGGEEMVPGLALTPMVAAAGPRTAVPPEEVAAAVARCGADFHATDGQSFRQSAPGEAWDGHAIVSAVSDRDACVVLLAPGREPAVHRATLVTCLNCLVTSVAAVGFEDIDRDGVPDVSLAAEGIVGWDPRSTTEPLVGGLAFAAWKASADWSALTELPAAHEVSATSLQGLWAALRAPSAPRP